MERQLLLPIADEIKDELLVREIVERVDARISRALASHLPHVLPRYLAQFDTEIASRSGQNPDDGSNLLRWLRDQDSHQRAEIESLLRSHAELEDRLKELRKYAEQIDLIVKAIRIDFAFLAQVMRKHFLEDYDEADWWKRGSADEEDW